ncbi:MAG: ferrous iron transport protein B [Chitinispirillia bacterium]|nr:ferrous iron transport protein B [Chitinispirillia bacterium]MCL2242214.1 ferrous iron transport protein B [Chitinispirillia bacterium]
MIIALAGNPNCGKTTLFNQVTGSHRHVGNFPGVTVEQKTGDIVGHKGVSVVDMPGIYSLTSYSSDEIISRDFLLKQKPDAIINIVDATNIERNLYLTMQLIELQIPMVIALNMMDEVQENNGSIDILHLRDALGVTVVPISAKHKQGLAELVEVTMHAALHKTRPQRIDFCSADATHRAIHAITHLIEDHALKYEIPARFAATKLVEGDEKIRKQLNLSKHEEETIEHAVTEMVAHLGTDREAAIVDMRYHFIEETCRASVVKAKESREYRRSVKLDNVLTHKFLAIPVFFGIMFSIFWLTFDVIGSRLSDWMASGMEYIGDWLGAVLEEFGLNPAVHSLVMDGAYEGVSAVLGFLPFIVVLFLFLSLLEDSGYMARVAFVMDKLLRKIGLSGRSIVPMLMGFGCSVPAIMSARTLASERDKKMTVLLTPFMSCGAKVPVYVLFIAAFFAEHQALVMMALYLSGVLLAVLSGLVMSRTVFRGAPVPFVLEMPNYRFPSVKTVLLLLWDRSRDFINRAFTFILVATVIIWFLQYFDVRLNHVENIADSMLAYIGRLLAPFFAPLGLGDWRISTALVTGFSAKEVVVSTLAVLADVGEDSLAGALHAFFTPLSAVSFLIFTLLYTPCVAAVATFKRELGSFKGMMLVILYQTTVAWLAAFCVYRVGWMMGWG